MAIAFLVLWLSIGLTAGGISFAGLQNTYAEYAAEDRGSDVVCFWVAIVAGPLGLAGVGLGLVKGTLEFHGFLLPCRWSYYDSTMLQQRVRQRKPQKWH
ncbi:hypothetical protein A2853_00595 [Candidatus Kaiserbacteria bacterium RIFCSPHIGHO2_01_FULL_55_17]|uniref:Uncharacterized protein n=1 Tax=Candidatus Kaiserbacteria bacterium RIFCSPHIGHO2_01_FULL_55_17 TaxID=1798484 RepID=A0A1F6D7J7_9BACT|nr:MAG: hypothetical protein A2853_00595 [Candidatus Kaiserbacteria bacterium RIFCSPHIGHO2_01_FULL_55_17]